MLDPGLLQVFTSIFYLPCAATKSSSVVPKLIRHRGAVGRARSHSEWVGQASFHDILGVDCGGWGMDKRGKHNQPPAPFKCSCEKALTACIEHRAISKLGHLDRKLPPNSSRDCYFSAWC